MFENVVAEVGTLLGFAAFVMVLVNILKYFGVVKDGTADKWVAGLNLLGILLLYFTRLVRPEFDVLPVDATLKEVAVVGTAILSYVIMIGGSRLSYEAVRNLPLIGKSNTPMLEAPPPKPAKK